MGRHAKTGRFLRDDELKHGWTCKNGYRQAKVCLILRDDSRKQGYKGRNNRRHANTARNLRDDAFAIILQALLQLEARELQVS